LNYPNYPGKESTGVLLWKPQLQNLILVSIANSDQSPIDFCKKQYQIVFAPLVKVFSHSNKCTNRKGQL